MKPVFTVKHVKVACPREAITIAQELTRQIKTGSGEIEVDKDTCITVVFVKKCVLLMLLMEVKIPTSMPTDSFDINVDKDKCVYCLVCKKACPVDAIMAACRSCSYGEYDIDPADAETTGRCIY